VPNAQLAGVDFWDELARPQAVLRWGLTRAFEFVSGDRARSEADELLHHAVVTPPVALWLAGAGHVAQAVAPLARSVGFEVHVFDDRPALVSHEVFPEEVILHCANWPALLAHTPSPPAFGVIMTRGHEHDAIVLRSWLRAGFGFLGMIGSRRKARLMRESFTREGVASEDQMAAVESPVGLDISAQSPGEIAVSIVARLIERRANALQPAPAAG
jgi:xanthine dehydrogenase accessory factor